jgi:hypothetical protein
MTDFEAFHLHMTRLTCSGKGHDSRWWYGSVMHRKGCSTYRTEPDGTGPARSKDAR